MQLSIYLKNNSDSKERTVNSFEAHLFLFLLNFGVLVDSSPSPPTETLELEVVSLIKHAH